MIADTTFLIDLLRNSPEALKKASGFDIIGESVFTTTISVFELWQGSLDLKDKKKIDRIHILLDALGMHSLDLESAKIAGKVHAELREKGLPIDPEDSMIAGICIKTDHALLTRNIKHFSRIKELKLETY